MTCAAPGFLPDAASRRSSGAAACPQAHKLVIVAAGKPRHRLHPRSSRRAKPAARRLPPGTLEEHTSRKERASQHAATPTASLPNLPLTRRPAAAAAKKLHSTTGAKTMTFESRSTGALPVLLSLPSTSSADGGAMPSGGKSPSPSKSGATKRRDLQSRLDEGRHSGSDRPLRKQRRGNHGDGSTEAGGASGGGRRGGRGPVKIWCCPSTSSLREEACGDLRGMARPGLWRSPRQLSEEVEAGHHRLDRLKARFKAERKRRAGGGVGAGFLSLLRAELGEGERERWMGRRGVVRKDRFTVEQRRELREWFDCLDKDGSGEIDSSELSHPLLCTGLARSALEVGRLVREVDKDGSGEIGFTEFLAIFQPKGVEAGTSTIDKIVHLQDVKKAHGSDMQTVVATARRTLLIKEILDEAAFRTAVADDVEKQRFAAQSTGDLKALKALREKEESLERRRLEKNIFIQAVSDATDFQQERERIDEAVKHKARLRDRCRKKQALASDAGALSAPLSTYPEPRPRGPGNACPAAPVLTPSARFSEPKRARYGHAVGAHSGGATAPGDGGGEDAAAACCGSSGGGGGGGGSGGKSGGASAFSIFVGSPDVQRLLSPEERRLEQRGQHHNNFKRSASARNLDGTDGMIGPTAPPGSRGVGNHVVAAAPVSVTASVRVLSGGETGACSSSSSPPPPLLNALPAAAGTPTDQAPLLTPPHRADSSGSSGRSSSSARKDSPPERSGSRAHGRSSGGAGGAGGEAAGRPLPTATEGRSAVVTTGPVQGAARAVLPIAAAAGESLAEGKYGANAASYLDPAGVAADEVSVGGTGEAAGSLGARYAADWYRQSKLSAAASGAAPLGLGAGRADGARG